MLQTESQLTVVTVVLEVVLVVLTVDVVLASTSKDVEVVVTVDVV